MRFVAYVSTSTVLATGVLFRALHQRANFYSACVYLAQSNACLMILTNLVLIGLCSVMLGLQRLLFGPLRPTEIEQLYEKSWYAVTETCLAMTIFRDEVGGWFLVMFVSLLIGKVWGWIGEGRVEILEQQPPANPRLFHVRLSLSLISSSLFEILMFRYSVQTVLLQARPNMMVMFAFEFAVLTITSLSTAARYLISLHESSIIRTQINRRRAQLNQLLQSTQGRAPGPESLNVVSQVDGQPEYPDGMNNITDIDVPGWEEKGKWVFYLDLMTDFCKLVLYLAFFSVLCMFYGMPIHIIRDVAITVRSFYKRIRDFIRYRQATKDMNARYPDATSEEIQREDVCIICRELMHAWEQPHEVAEPQNSEIHSGLDFQGDRRYNNATDTTIAGDDRLRPKKLPCGHILHCACLRSWLERQQICPTCRAPVLVSNLALPHSQSENATRDVTAQEQRPGVDIPAHPGGLQRNIRQNTVRLGPFRFSYGIRQDVAREDNLANRADPQNSAQSSIEPQHDVDSLGRLRQAPNIREQNIPNFSSSGFQGQLLQLEQQLLREIHSLRAHASQLFLIRALEAELARLQRDRYHETLTIGERSVLFQPFAIELSQGLQYFISGQSSTSSNEQRILGAGQGGLPSSLMLPTGWNILSLHRVVADGEDGSAVFSLPIFNNRSQWDPITHPFLPRTDPFVPFAVNYPVIEEQRTSQGERSTPEQSGSNLLASVSHANVPPLRDNCDTDIQLVRHWDREEMEIGQAPNNSMSEGMKEHQQEIALPQASPDSGSIIASEPHSSLCTKLSRLQVKAGNEPGPDQLEVQGDGHLRSTPPVSKGKQKRKGNSVTVEDIVEDGDV